MLSDIWCPPWECSAAGDQPTGWHVERAQVLNEAIREAVELQPVAVGAHAAIAQEIAGILMRKKVFSRRHGGRDRIGTWPLAAHSRGSPTSSNQKSG